LLQSAIGADWKPWLSQVFFATAALLWLIPDRRIEKVLESSAQQERQ
jgi:hypothetical protein